MITIITYNPIQLSRECKTRQPPKETKITTASTIEENEKEGWISWISRVSGGNRW